MPVEPFSSTHNPQGDDGTETIGSRLRKRRRTGMSPNDGNLSTPKSLVQRKATSSNRKKAEPAIALVEAPREQPHISPLDNQPHNAKHLLQDILPHISGQGSMALRTTSRQGMDGNKKSLGNMADQSSSPDANPHPQEHQLMSSAGPDLAAVIANIIEHGEAVERRYNEMGYVDTESFGYLGASHHLKTQSLPILDNLVCLTRIWIFGSRTNIPRQRKY